MMIGFARGILIVMQTGHIMDTFVYGMFMPLSALPQLAAAEAMLMSRPSSISSSPPDPARPLFPCQSCPLGRPARYEPPACRPLFPVW